jgi:hypothetical protein
MRVQKVEVDRFKDSRHMKVVRLSTLLTGCFTPQEIFLVLISVRGCVDPNPQCGRKIYVNGKFQ